MFTGLKDVNGKEMLKSDYFRIEIDLLDETGMFGNVLKSDYFRIEISLSSTKLFLKLRAKIRLF